MHTTREKKVCDYIGKLAQPWFIS